MQYVGMHTQIARNNMLSILLLISFPVILLGMLWVLLAAFNYFNTGNYYNEYGEEVYVFDLHTVNINFITLMPLVVIGVGVWFIIAYFSNASMVRNATGARSLERRENPRVYNIVENLTMTCGMDMPKINIIDDPQLNAFASGIDKYSYTVTVTTGLLEVLNDEELAGVLGHELTHIRNRDTRLLITSIIFVGIFSTLAYFTVNLLSRPYLISSFFGSRSKNEKGNGLGFLALLAIAAIVSVIGYLITQLTRFAISRKREYMADAGGAEMCGDPMALASALRKISNDPGLSDVKREDIAQLFIIHPQMAVDDVVGILSELFSTHPDTAKRIAILEQFYS